MPAKLDKKEFIKKLKYIFQRRFDFSLVEYVNMKTGVIINCKIHGEVLMSPETLIYRKIGCKECNKEEVRLSRRVTQEEFIEKCKNNHGEIYEYTKTKYIDSKTPVLIKCKTHGFVEQVPVKFVKRGCSFCNEERRLSAQRCSTEEFIQKAINVHKKIYGFDKTDYIGSKKPVIIKCMKHGYFTIIPSNFLKGSGCRSCGIERGGNKRRSNSKEFIQKAIKIHGDRYDYNNVVYKSAKEHVDVTCRVHGDFSVSPSNHLSNKRGCPDCAGHKSRAGILNLSRRVSQSEFLTRAKNAHTGKNYNFDKAIYITQNDNVIVTCPLHGDFKIRPYNLWNGGGCFLCAVDKNSQNQLRDWEFLKEELSLLHEYKYEYSNTLFNGMNYHFNVECNIHGEFRILPTNHLYRKGGCPDCKLINFGARSSKINTYNNQVLISKFNEIHADFYDYSKVIHTHINDEVIIICKEHGEFKQIPRNHLQGKGCRECGRKSAADKIRLTNKEIISIFRNVHGNRYDYSEVVYVTNQDKVKIICKIHGPFWQTPNSHRQRKGCSNCSMSKGEALIASILDNGKINYLAEYPVLNPKTGHNLRFDFYLPEKNIFIEFDGLQHFEPVNFGGMSFESSLKVHTRLKARDKIKDKLAKEMDVKLLRIKYDQDIQESLNDNLIIK